MKRVLGIGVPLVLILAVSAYLIGTVLWKEPSSKPGHRVIKRSLSLPGDLQDALRAAAAEDAPAYVKDKRFLPAIARLAGELSSKGGFDAEKLTDTIEKLGSMKNMGPDIMAQSLQQESETTGELEKEVMEETVDKIFARAEDGDDDDDDDDDGGGNGGHDIKAEVDFAPEKGMIEDDLFAPPGMHVKVDVEEDPGEDSEPDGSSQAMAFSYPMGMGNALMNGCFGTGYVPGDPCYNVKDVIPACYDMMEGCGYVGVGFDGRGFYSSVSRKKTVVQRNCNNMATYHGEDVPDTMNVQGVFDTDVASYVYESREAYRQSLQMKAGMSFSGFGFQADVESAYGKSTSSQKQTFMSLIQCNVVRYEIFLDEISPDTLSLAFLRDFLSLPPNFIDDGKGILRTS
ncbi:Hypp9430 [Branchiostoma lanceolatum]|uniref:Hypp9430 protein n=1 Tax=Branchiostoma lanceolatum TaxID=7740 RepID=A0A8S4MM64_BRALA|nr:Hypp9430 [Branchiostoma lanceolatum]